MIRKWRNQKEILTPKTEVGRSKMTVIYNEITYRKPNEQIFPNRRPLSD